MSDPRDDDALAWAGDDDPTLAPEGAPAPEPVRADRSAGAASAVPVGAAPVAPRRTVLDEAEDAEDLAVERELADAERASKQMGSASLVVLGILGGIYLLYTIGWIVSFSRYAMPDTIDFSVVSFRITQALAVAASPLWFVATLLLTQKRHARYRFLWLVIGMIVLVPWPFLMGA